MFFVCNYFDIVAYTTTFRGLVNRCTIKEREFETEKRQFMRRIATAYLLERLVTQEVQTATAQQTSGIDKEI